MDITDVKVFPVHEEKLKAYVSVVLDGCFIVSDIKIIQGGNGLFISMPSKKKKNGEFKDVAHPLNRETRELFERRIIGEYQKIGAEAGTVSASEGAGVSAPPSEMPGEQAASSHQHH
jgi:stage V sporulation protein G